MGTERTAWHVLFAALIEERAPPDVEVTVEHVLTVEPQKADLLLIRRGQDRHDDSARVLRRLWPEITRETLVEFKSISRPPRRGDWIRLLGYAAQHHAKQIERLDLAAELTFVLLVPALTPTVLQEAKSLGWTLEDLEDGYHRVHGSEYPGLLAVLGDVADAERDDLLRWFATAKLQEARSTWWIMSHKNVSSKNEPKIEELEGYERINASLFTSLPPEELRSMLEALPREQLRSMLALLPADEVRSMLASLPREQLRSMLPTEERLSDLAPEEAVLALPDEILRALSPEFVATLPESIQAEIRKRLSH